MKSCDLELQIEAATRLNVAAEGRPVGILRLAGGMR
jgi:hypothetical protein